MSSARTNLARIVVAAMLALSACLVVWWPQGAAGSDGPTGAPGAAATSSTPSPTKTPAVSAAPTSTPAVTSAAPPPPAATQPTSKPSSRDGGNNNNHSHNNNQGPNTIGNNNNSGSGGGKPSGPKPGSKPSTPTTVVSTPSGGGTDVEANDPAPPADTGAADPGTKPDKGKATPTPTPAVEPTAESTDDGSLKQVGTTQTYETSPEPVETGSAPVWGVPGILLVLTSMLALLGGVLGRGSRPALAGADVFDNRSPVPTSRGARLRPRHWDSELLAARKSADAGGVWWVWALGLAAAATHSPPTSLVLLTIVAVATWSCWGRRSGSPSGSTFHLYVIVAIVIVVMRVLFRVLLEGGLGGGHVLLDLPEIPLPDWVLGLHLLGPVTLESVLAGRALRRAAVRHRGLVICVGAANALANPKRLLRSVPGRAARGRHRAGRGRHHAAGKLVDSGRGVGGSPGAAGGGHPGAPDGCAATWCPHTRAPLSGRCRLAASDGHPRLRPVGRRVAARERRLTGALMLVGLLRRLRRRLRRPRPHRPAAAGHADAGCWASAAAVAGLVTAGRRVGRSHLPARPVALAGVRS